LFEGLIELSDGAWIMAAFSESTWRGDPRTVVRLE
jgi:hypothetical protein